MISDLIASPGRFPRATALLVALLAGACGGGSTGPQPPGPPPPPPPPPTPASLSVGAGDNQEGEPGKALATAPTVVVKSANGAGVPNITVTFAIESGGGTVANPTATTDASGVASAGMWTVGAEEGPQVLVASAGNLTPVKIRATAKIPTTVVSTGSVTTGGNTITVNQPGSPLDGVSITFQNGGVAGAAPITLASTSSVGVKLPAGVTPVGRGLLITSSATLTKPAIVRFPSPEVEGKYRIVGAYDPSSGRIEVLPPISSDANGITVLLPRLDASLVAAPQTASFFRAASAREDQMLGLLSAVVDLTVLDKDFDSGFRAGVDNWDFDNLAVAWLPFLAGAEDGDPAEEVIDPANGMIATQLWYFLNQRDAGGPLHKRFRIQPDQLTSNRVGIRWSALVNRGVSDHTAQVSKSFEELLSDNLATFTETQFLALKAFMYFSQEDRPAPRPIPILLYDAFTTGEERIFAVDMGIATRTIGRSIEFVVAYNEQSAYRGNLGEFGLVPVTVVNRSGEKYEARTISPLMLTPILDNPAIRSNWPKVLAGTVGDAEGWPTPELHWEKGKLDPASVFVGDQVRFWWQCPTCRDFGNTFPGLPESASHPQAFQMGRIIGGTMAALPEGKAFASVAWDADSVASDTEPTVTGHGLYLPQPALPDGRFPAGWLDWQTVNFRKVTLHPSPGAVELDGEETVGFALAPSQPLPAGTTYSWVLRTKDGRDSVATAAPTHSRKIAAGTEGTLLIMAHEAGTRRVIARDSVPVSGGAGAYWRIDTITDDDELLDPDNEAGGPITEMLRRLMEVPGAGIFGISPIEGGSELIIRVKTNGIWTTDLCCPPGPLGGDGQFYLGRIPKATYTVGSFFAGWDFTDWSQSTTDLTTGTMTGQFVDALISWPVEGGTQQGPGHGVRLTATRNGAKLTGTITFATWFVGDDDNVLDEDADLYRFSFTATRIGAGPAPVKRAAVPAMTGRRGQPRR